MADVFRSLVILAGICACLSSAKRNRGSVTFRYLPRPECPEKAVCAEVSQLNRTPWSSDTDELPLLTSFICKCPDDQECPTHPGTHTLHVGKGRWYSTCKPICSFEKCGWREVAEEVLVGAKNFGGRTYRKVNCLCPGYEDSDMDENETATRLTESKTDDPRAKVVYQRSCTDHHRTWKRSGAESEIDELERRMMEEKLGF